MFTEKFHFVQVNHNWFTDIVVETTVVRVRVYLNFYRELSVILASDCNSASSIVF